MMIVKLSTTNRLDFLYLFILFAMTSLYGYFFWDLPLSEDAGYYAFLSKAMLHGMILHNDTPATTNSLLLYLTAGLFKIFGPSKITFRMIYVVGYVLLITSIYKLVSRERSQHEAFIASLLAAILVMIPHIMLDLGRNQIIWCLAMMMIGLYFKLNDRNNFIAGFCFAIAALMRETFLVVLVSMVIILAIKILLNLRNKNRDVFLKVFIHFFTGAVFGLFINVVLLSYYHSWEHYLTDMLTSGVSFRYKHPFAIKHLRNNLHEFHYGFVHYYCPIIMFGILSYFFPAKGYSLINWLKYLFLPIFFIEAVIVNLTQTYSIAPILVVCSILTVYFWSELFKLTLRNLIFKGKSKYYALFFVLLLYSMITFPYYIAQIYSNYHDYYELLEKRHIQVSNWSTERVKKIILNLPKTGNISAGSMYPLLFEISTPVQYNYPYLYDLSAPENLSRPKLAEAQQLAIDRQDPDIIILKGVKDLFYYQLKSVYGYNPIKKHYIIVADFGLSDASTLRPYKNRVLISRRFFHRYFYHDHSFHQQYVDPFIKVTNNNDQAIIARIASDPMSCITGFQLTNGVSQVTFNANDYLTQELFTLILPHSTAIIKKVHSCSQRIKHVSIDIYKTRDYSYSSG